MLTLESISYNFIYQFRTDFYVIQETQSQQYGFPKGIAKTITLKTFEKYDKLSKDELKEKFQTTDSGNSK